MYADYFAGNGTAAGGDSNGTAYAGSGGNGSINATVDNLGTGPLTINAYAGGGPGGNANVSGDGGAGGDPTVDIDAEANGPLNIFVQLTGGQGGQGNGGRWTGGRGGSPQNTAIINVQTALYPENTPITFTENFYGGNGGNGVNGADGGGGRRNSFPRLSQCFDPRQRLSHPELLWWKWR